MEGTNIIFFENPFQHLLKDIDKVIIVWLKLSQIENEALI